MPLFQIAKDKLTPVAQANFLQERELQRLIEANLGPVFSCRLVASEFSTGAQHAGRIDTLALSEDNNPVIIEYKKVESSELINQSLYYLSWIHDHRGDFQVAAQQAFGKLVPVDWSDVRVICIAPNYKKYDLHAVQMMGANIELWTYRLFDNSCIYLEEVFQKTYVPPSAELAGGGKNPIMVEAGKKAAQSRLTGSYTVEEHLEKKPQHIQDIAHSVQDYIRGLDASIEEAPKKFYVAYRTSQNIVCMEVQKQKILLYLKLDPKKDPGPPGISRDVSEIGHFGTGDLEVTVKTPADFEASKPFIEKAYREIGG
jgi:predicted transport protein